MKHLWIPIIIIVLWLLGSAVVLTHDETFEIEQLSLPFAVVIAICGYIYQSGENRRIQDLQFKRETYARLMESFSILKISGDKTPDEKREMTKVYFRSWAETSDRVNGKILEFLEAYIAWAKNKNDKTRAFEIQKFDELTDQIKQEISPKSKSKFTPFDFM